MRFYLSVCRQLIFMPVMVQFAREAFEHGVRESSPSPTNARIVTDQGFVESIQKHRVPGKIF